MTMAQVSVAPLTFALFLVSGLALTAVGAAMVRDVVELAGTGSAALIGEGDVVIESGACVVAGVGDGVRLCVARAHSEGVCGVGDARRRSPTFPVACGAAWWWAMPGNNRRRWATLLDTLCARLRRMAHIHKLWLQWRCRRRLCRRRAASLGFLPCDALVRIGKLKRKIGKIKRKTTTKY